MARPFPDPELPLTGEDRSRHREDVLSEEDRIALVEEQAVLGKRVVDQGGVRVTTRTELIPETVRDVLTETSVEVERVPVGRFVEAAEEPRVLGDVTVVPVYEERLVVEKRLYLVEEVHLRRLVTTREVELPIELRRQEAHVERLPPLDGATGPAEPPKE